MNRPRFDLEAMQKLVDDRRRPRAEGIVERGAVHFVEIQPTHVIAHIDGESGVWVVRMGETDGSDCRCSCPDFADNGQGCKHTLATAMACEALTDVEVRQVTGQLSKLRETLELMGEDDPYARVDEALADPKLFRSMTEEPVD